MKVIILFLLLSVFNAQANEALDNLLDNKKVEFVGFCLINEKKELVLEKTKSTSLQECVIGVEKGNDETKFVLLWNKQKLDVLIQFNIKTNKQKIIWHNPDSIV